MIVWTIRMNENRKLKMLIEATPHGVHGRGRPKLEWEKWEAEVAGARGKMMRHIRIGTNRNMYKKWLKDPDA